MNLELAALASKHGLSDDVLADLEALSTAVVDEDLSVVLALDGAEGHPAMGAVDVAARYEDLGLLGEGGMATVRRVRDTVLNRDLAMKIVHAGMLDQPSALARFLEEAQATAQLQHPNILPVHDLGRLPDGRVWFTMKEVRGRTLGRVLHEVHTASREGWQAGPSGWTFRRLITTFLAVCRAMAFAHDRGVLHRDLKPSNIMVGGPGEVYVLDWGLAKVLGHRDPAADVVESDVVRSGRGLEHATRWGVIAGTPAYMPPEQANGELDRIDARTDVYALGAVLYVILGGVAPYRGSAVEVLSQVLNRPPPPVGRPGLSLPPALVAACERAMEREPEQRFESAHALADEVEAWLDGSRRRERALELTARALAAVPGAEALAASAAGLREASDELLRDVALWEPEERKVAGWERAAEAESAEQAARLRQLEVDETLRAALQIDPDLPEAHAALAERYRRRFDAAEAARDPRAQSEARTLLESHTEALPTSHVLRHDVAEWLKGDGSLTLVTDPPGAEVWVVGYAERHRRLVETAPRLLGRTPLQAVLLPMGSYVCLLRHPDCDEVRYPVEIMRRGHWDGDSVVWVPPRGWLGSDEVYIPAGPFRAGGDPEVRSLPAQRVWGEAFVIQRFVTTNREYIAFLDELVAQGRESEALRHVPRVGNAVAGELGASLYGFDGTRFELRVDAEGDEWLPDNPAIHVDWYGARAYLAWLAERTGRPWRLPHELEWEKAARGVDGRRFPWGQHHDPSWSCMFDSFEGRKMPTVVDSFPVDTSPYGVRGMGGLVSDWTDSRLDGGTAEIDADTRVVTRGGAWGSNARGARSAYRNRFRPGHRGTALGFRGVYSPASSA